MSNTDFKLPKPSLAYAKIVANPTPNSWSQVYNAGSLFAALSLTTAVEADEEINLPVIGKEIFNNLEAEFFSLEEKNLNSIKGAVEKSFSSISSKIEADASLCFYKDNILYLFIFGRGKIIMRRKEKLGTLLEKKTDDPQIETASGYLENGDVVALLTDHFYQNVSSTDIDHSFELELPNDIAESLAPKVHEKEDGGQAAIIIAYNGIIKTRTQVQEEVLQQNTGEAATTEREEEIIDPPKNHKTKFKVNFKIPGLTRIKLISLIAGVAILIILIGGIIFTKINQENDRTQSLYKQVAADVQRNIKDGERLVKLNPAIAQDSFMKASQILKDNLSKFKSGSKEEAELQALLKETENNLKGTAPVNKVEAKTTSVDKYDILNIEKDNAQASASQDNTSVYLLTDKGVSSINKSDGSKKDIINNDKDWADQAAIAAYQGNIYILDKKAGVLKYVAGADGFGKSSYFKGSAPNLSQARSMSIDGSIWILLDEGKILKYTSGTEDEFSISGIDKPLASPSKILTDINLDYIYILDNGNSRIVKLAKSGAFQAQYSADILNKAQEIEVDQKEQNIFVLSGGKIYEIAL